MTTTNTLTYFSIVELAEDAILFAKIWRQRYESQARQDELEGIGLNKVFALTDNPYTHEWYMRLMEEDRGYEVAVPGSDLTQPENTLKLNSRVWYEFDTHTFQVCRLTKSIWLPTLESATRWALDNDQTVVYDWTTHESINITR